MNKEVPPPQHTAGLEVQGSVDRESGKQGGLVSLLFPVRAAALSD